MACSPEIYAEMQAAMEAEFHNLRGNTMRVRAKMYVGSLTKFASGSEVKLSAIYGTEGENKDFADATPSGSATFNISEGRPAAEFFKPGKNYYVTFEEAP